MANVNDLLIKHLAQLSREYGFPEEQIKEKILQIFGNLLKERYPNQNTIVKWEESELTVYYERNEAFLPLDNRIIDKKILSKIFPLLRHQLQQGKSTALLDYFRGKEGQLFLCKVRGSSQFGINIMVGNFQGIIRHSDKIPEEEYNQGQNLLCLLKQIDERGANTVYFTRRGTNFIHSLMQKYIPDIATGRVRIIKIARIDGVMSKIAVASSFVNPIGACMGPENSHRDQIIAALGTNNEKIVFVEYCSDPEEYLIRSLGYERHIKNLNIRDGIVNVECEEQYLRKLIGKGASNVRLATYLQNKEIKAINLLNSNDYQEKINAFKMEEQLDFRRNFLEFCGEEAESLVESLDLFLQTIIGPPSSRDSNNAEEKLAKKLQEYEAYLQAKEMEQFFQAGGSKALAKSLPELPIEFLWKLKQQEISSLEDIIAMGDAGRLAEKCRLTQDVAMLIFNSAENAAK